jgi:hypothetical protein
MRGSMYYAMLHLMLRIKLPITHISNYAYGNSNANKPRFHHQFNHLVKHYDPVNKIYQAD